METTNTASSFARLYVELVREETTAPPVSAKRARAIYDMLKGEYAAKGREYFLAIPVDVQNKVIGVHTVSIGSLTSSLVHPREVFQPAILANAAAVIVAHNHPSGDVSPSSADLAVTRRLIEAGALLGIPLLDHVIIGLEGFSSLRTHLDFNTAGTKYADA